MTEKISVLMPVYNRQDFIERSVHSILNQTYKNFDLIIFDDGSTDKTPEIIKALQDKDFRIKYFREEKNHGVAYGRNKLLDLCQTKYAAWMDSDDYSYPLRLEKQVKNLGNYDMVFVQWENIKKKQPGTTLGFATLTFKVDKNIRFCEELQWGGEDWLWIGKMREAGNQEIYIKEILYSIDFHGNRIGSWKRKLWNEWGGKYSSEELEGLTYSEAIAKFKKEQK